MPADKKREQHLFDDFVLTDYRFSDLAQETLARRAEFVEHLLVADCELFDRHVSSFTVLLFLTTIPVLSRNAARLRARAARRASLPVAGPMRDTPWRHCSSLRRCSAAVKRVPPETPSAPADSFSTRHSTRPLACASCNQMG